MELFKPNIKNLIENKDYQGLSRTLSGNPNLSNAGHHHSLRHHMQNKGTSFASVV
jgi:hypothetical protein